MEKASSRLNGISDETYILMHAEEIVAIAYSASNRVDVKRPNKMPFGLRSESVDYIQFVAWLRKRVDHLRRTYMDKVYMARKVGHEFENIIRDSYALSITDQFWVRPSDIAMSWEKLNALRDQNEALAHVALSGDTANLDEEAVMKGTTSLFTTKGLFPKAILGNRMQKRGGTQEREWVASMIGKALGLPVQDAIILKPSVSIMHDAYTTARTDDTLVEITLFTSEHISLVHASELFCKADFGDAHLNGQHHRYFYDRLPCEAFKRAFERVLILNWLISNHDMHGENYGCLYAPETFEIIGIAPSFDHNSADFDGTIPELDVPDIIKPNLHHHADIISKITSGLLERVLDEVKEWLTQEQKNGVRHVALALLDIYKTV